MKNLYDEYGIETDENGKIKEGLWKLGKLQ